MKALGQFIEGRWRLEGDGQVTTGADPHVPFAGIKDSGGHFRELGTVARDFYTRLKTVYLQP